MKGTVNPFEPWRPTTNRIPPPLHVGRPWRPPPPPPRAAVEEPLLVEPVKPLPRSKPPERPKRLQRQPTPTSPLRTPISSLAAFELIGLWTILIFDLMGWLCGSHAPRLVVLGASAGLFAGMAFNQRRSWSTRLSWMAATLALAAIALWFVPTTHGVNLWSAYRQVESLRALPAGDLAGYQRGWAARRALMHDFPSFAWDVRVAEQAWLRHTVDETIESADRQLNKDPDGALLRLQQLDKALSQLHPHASVRKDLESARRRAVQACAKAAQQP